VSTDEGRPADDDRPPLPEEKLIERREAALHQILEEALKRHRDAVLGGAPPDRDEAVLDALESHLRATGEFNPDGSVWRRMDQDEYAPPNYTGPRTRKGAHRTSRTLWGRIMERISR
jgi:hypothetical protein